MSSRIENYVIYSSDRKIAEMTVFTDGFSFLHYTIHNMPANQWGEKEEIIQGCMDAGMTLRRAINST